MQTFDTISRLQERKFPIKVPNDLIRLIFSNPTDTISATLAKQLIQIILPDEKIKEYQMGKLYTKKVNLDADPDLEIVFSLNNFIKEFYELEGITGWLDNRDQNWYLLHINYNYGYNYDIDDKPFDINEQQKCIVFATWGGSGNNGDEYFFHFYKLLSDSVQICLEVLGGSNFCSEFMNLGESLETSNRYHFYAVDSIAIKYHYKLSYSPKLINLDRSEYSTINPIDSFLLKRDEICIIDDTAVVNYVWNKDSLKYLPHFELNSKLNRAKINSFFYNTGGDIPFFINCFRNEIRLVQANGDEFQRRFIKLYLQDELKEK